MAAFKPGVTLVATTVPHTGPPLPGSPSSLSRPAASPLEGPMMPELLGKGSYPAGEEISEEGRGRGSERDRVNLRASEYHGEVGRSCGFFNVGK